MAEPILSVRGLHVRFSLRGRSLHALRGIDLDVLEGESLAIVGESRISSACWTRTGASPRGASAITAWAIK